MSITAANLTDGIRVDQATQKGSVYDVISMITKATSAYAVRVLSRIHKQYPEMLAKCHWLRINGKGRKTPVADTETLQKIALAVLSGCRRSMTDKTKMLQDMGLPMQYCMRSFVEEETLQPLLTVFQHLAPVKQFSCGEYRVDLYFPLQKVAVECDEGDHKQYDFAADYERQRFIEQQLSCQFVRYNPHSADFNVFRLIAQLMPLLTTVKLPSYRMRSLYNDYISPVYRLTMSITAANLTDGIRVDRATKKGSVNDVIAVITGKKGSYATQVFSRIKEHNTEFVPKCDKLRINGKGRETPVADAATLVEVAWLCPGKAATQFRRKGAETVCRMLGGDLTLVDEIQRRHAQVAGTAEEEFLLADVQGGPQQANPHKRCLDDDEEVYAARKQQILGHISQQTIKEHAQT